MARLAVMVFALMTVSPAFAHDNASLAGGFVGGFAHPFFGADHVAAMIAVGLWGAFLGMPAMLILPVVFPLVMATGGVLGILGIPMPGIEIGIAASAVVLGLMVALAATPNPWFAAGIVGVFALFHGHAHGAELPAGTDAVAYSIGFVIATGLLHMAGIGFGLLAQYRGGRVVVRAAGSLIAAAGLVFLGRLI